MAGALLSDRVQGRKRGEVAGRAVKRSMAREAMTRIREAQGARLSCREGVVVNKALELLLKLMFKVT